MSRDQGYDKEPSPPSAAELEDRWQRRGTAMRCSTCMYYVPKRTEFLRSVEQPEIGRCRRHAPTLGGWPVVFHTDWCGDHKIDEIKV